MEDQSEEKEIRGYAWSLYPMAVVAIVLFVTFTWHDTDIEKHKEVLTIAGGLIAFIAGLWQYAKAQEWKKTEFLAQEYKSFIQDRYVQRVMQLLDYPISNFQLFNDENIFKLEGKVRKKIKSDDGKLPVTIVGCNYNLIKDALSERHDDQPFDKYDERANIIRYSFDKFFFKLGLFQKYIDSGLIKKEDLRHYLTYWICLLQEHENKSLKNHAEAYKEMKIELINFIRRYEYTHLISLLANFGTSMEELCKKHKIQSNDI